MLFLLRKIRYYTKLDTVTWGEVEQWGEVERLWDEVERFTIWLENAFYY